MTAIGYGRTPGCCWQLYALGYYTLAPARLPGRAPHREHWQCQADTQAIHSQALASRDGRLVIGYHHSPLTAILITIQRLVWLLQIDLSTWNITARLTVSRCTGQRLASSAYVVLPRVS